MEIDNVVARIDELLDAFGTRLDARARAQAEELVQVLMEMYGAGLARILEILQEAGGPAAPLLERLADDKLIASLLLIHDLHPVDAEARIRRALERIGRRHVPVRAELMGVADGVATVRVNGGVGLSASQGAELTALIEEAVREAAPELEEIRVEDLTGPLVQIAPAPAG